MFTFLSGFFQNRRKNLVLKAIEIKGTFPPNKFTITEIEKKFLGTEIIENNDIIIKDEKTDYLLNRRKGDKPWLLRDLKN